MCHIAARLHSRAAKNGIPIFCPPITDGSIGDMLFFHSYKNPGLRVDLVEDIRAINDLAMKSSPRRTGMILLGGGGFPLLSERGQATNDLGKKTSTHRIACDPAGQEWVCDRWPVGTRRSVAW